MRSLTLDDLIHPCSAEDFLANYAGTGFLHVPGEAHKFASLFPWSALNHILRTHRFGSKGIRMVSGGRAVPREAFLKDGIVRAPEMTELLREAATLVLERVDCMYEPVTGLAENLERVFEVPIQINMYAGWRVTHGFDVHWDDHDVIVLQVAGRKHWKIYGVTEKFPVKNSVELHSQPPTCDPVFDGLLNQGDVLYMPRGWWHVAIPCDEPTLHLTVGMRYPTGLDILRFVSQEMEQDVRMRMDLPLAGAASARTEVMKGVADAFASAIREPGLLDRFLKSTRAMASPRPSLGLPWSATLQAMPEAEDSVIRFATARGLEFEKEGDAGAINVVFNGKALTFAAAAKPLFDFLDATRPAPAEVSVGDFYSRFTDEFESATLRQFLTDLAKHGIIVLSEPGHPISRSQSLGR
jgi:ribosomal protein L16 Arg81 hydroxylase